ncbi:MAG: hypothetical protein ACD_3C00054G0031 [uncultured bacterium (gcode 4)]|uniref:Uncharacterized protein n=1 Tax=uncultured bacterium (gcode 4) TaxID=1234023 RepID=K2FBI5_9BACT|nr:MAG: hypothetical protein ACD_3C00054G0031 [uncultured bacterium (gcode 4)]
MEIPNDLHEYQCIWFIPEEVILEFAGFEIDQSWLVRWCEAKTVVDFWAGLSRLSSRFLNAKSVSAIDPMYFMQQDELWNNWFRWTSAIIEDTLKKLIKALENNEEIKYRVDFYWRMNWKINTIAKYKESVMMLIEDYYNRGEYLVWAEEAIRHISKYPDTSHLGDGSVDIVFLNALLFDTDYPFRVLSEANRILSEWGEIIVADYRNIWKNSMYEKIRKAWIAIVASDDNFYCVKLKKDDYKKINLWTWSTEKLFAPENPISPTHEVTEVRMIGFEWKDISVYQKVDGEYLSSLKEQERIHVAMKIDSIISSIPEDAPLKDLFWDNETRRSEFESILQESIFFIADRRRNSRNSNPSIGKSNQKGPASASDMDPSLSFLDSQDSWRQIGIQGY